MNAVQPGDEHPMSKVWSEGREAHAGDHPHQCALEECAQVGAELMAGWRDRPEFSDTHGSR